MTRRSARAGPSRLLRWHFQPLTPPQTLDALVVDLPARISQQGGDPAVAVAPILAGQFDHVGNQSIFVSPASRQLPLRRAMLAQHPAGPTFRQTQFLADQVDTGTTARGAQKFR